MSDETESIHKGLVAGKRRMSRRIGELTEALRRVDYLANVNYESSGEMANAVDQISDIARAILDGEGEK